MQWHRSYEHAARSHGVKSFIVCRGGVFVEVALNLVSLVTLSEISFDSSIATTMLFSSMNLAISRILSRTPLQFI